MLSVSFPHQFVGTDGVNPSGGLVKDSSGNLFGLAGTSAINTDGEVYEMVKGASSYTFKVLYTFTSANSSTAGYGPKGRLVLDSSGNLYGITDSGGSAAEGNIWEMTRASINSTPAVTTLYSFGAVSAGNGTFPENGLAISTTGTLTLYGTTVSGGNNPFNVNNGDGVVFKYVPSTSTYTVLHKFQSNNSIQSDNGANPSSTVSIDGTGNFWLTTQESTSQTGYGEIYKIDKTTLAATPIFDFGDTTTANPGFHKGRKPVGNLSTDSSGNIYGTAEEGGATYNAGTGAANYGTIWKINSAGTGLGTVWSFPTPSGSGNWNPQGGLLIDTTGNIFGTTRNGGSSGVGDVIEIPHSTGTLGEIQAFTTGPNTPTGTDLAYDSSGNLFGTTFAGSQSPVNTGDGTIWELSSLSVPPMIVHSAPANAGIAAFSNPPVNSQNSAAPSTIFSSSDAWKKDATDGLVN